MYTVVIAVDSELQTWERETKEEVARLIKSLTEEREGQPDILVYTCLRSALKVATIVEVE